MDCLTVMTQQIFCPTASVQGMNHAKTLGAWCCCCSHFSHDKVHSRINIPRGVQITTRSPATA